METKTRALTVPDSAVSPRSLRRVSTGRKPSQRMQLTRRRRRRLGGNLTRLRWELVPLGTWSVRMEVSCNSRQTTPSGRLRKQTSLLRRLSTLKTPRLKWSENRLLPIQRHGSMHLITKQQREKEMEKSRSRCEVCRHLRKAMFPVNAAKSLHDEIVRPYSLIVEKKQTNITYWGEVWGKLKTQEVIRMLSVKLVGSEQPTISGKPPLFQTASPPTSDAQSWRCCNIV